MAKSSLPEGYVELATGHLNHHILDAVVRDLGLPPYLSRYNKAQLADTFGILKAVSSALEERIDKVKNEMARRGTGQYDGTLFTCKVTERTRETLDREVFVRKLGEKWVDKHGYKKSAPYLDVRAYPRQYDRERNSQATGRGKDAKRSSRKAA